MEKTYKSKLFCSRHFATDGVFCLDTGPSEVMRCIGNCNRSIEDQITLNYLQLLVLQYPKDVATVLLEVPHYAVASKEEKEISDTGTYKN